MERQVSLLHVGMLAAAAAYKCQNVCCPCQSATCISLRRCRLPSTLHALAITFITAYLFLVSSVFAKDKVNSSGPACHLLLCI